MKLFQTSGISPPPLPPGIGLKEAGRPNPYIGWFIILVMVSMVRKLVTRKPS
jgi:hypothetical protein